MYAYFREGRHNLDDLLRSIASSKISTNCFDCGLNRFEENANFWLSYSDLRAIHKQTK